MVPSLHDFPAYLFAAVSVLLLGVLAEPQAAYELASFIVNDPRPVRLGSFASLAGLWWHFTKENSRLRSEIQAGNAGFGAELAEIRGTLRALLDNPVTLTSAPS